MSQHMVVDCNECKQEFEISEINVRRMEESVEENYFVCPHCQHEYPVFYTNVEIRNEQKKLRGLFSRLRNAKGEEARLKIEQIKQCKQQLSSMMDELKEKVGRKPMTSNDKAEVVIKKTSAVGRTEIIDTTQVHQQGVVDSV